MYLQSSLKFYKRNCLILAFVFARNSIIDLKTCWIVKDLVTAWVSDLKTKTSLTSMMRIINKKNSKWKEIQTKGKCEQNCGTHRRR